MPARDRADAQQRTLAAGALPVLRRGGREAAWTAFPAASASGSRWRSSCTRGANVLILDEPTNHLDLESREALEDALQHFQGALLLISHDRALLDAVGTRTVALEDQTLHSYVGGWPEYVRVREERAEAEKAAKRAKPVVAAAPKPVAQAAAAAPRSKNEVARAKKLEAQIEAAEAALAALEVELADPGAWNDPRTAAKSTARHAEAKKKLEALYASWEAVAG